MENPFVAPDIRDIIREKRISRRQAVSLLVAGAFFVIALFGIYFAIQIWFGGTEDAVVVEEVPVPEAEPVIPQLTREERLAELAEASTTTPPSAEERAMRAEELESDSAAIAPATQSVMTREERLQELEQY